VAATEAAADAQPVRLSHHIEYIAFRAVVAVFSALPVAWAVRIGASIGSLLYLIDVRDRGIALFNLGIAFPEKSVAERKRILRASCRNLGRLAAEFCHLPRLTVADASQLITIEDRPAWERVLATGYSRGVVVVTAHLGNWELLVYAQALWRHPVAIVHRTLGNPLVDEWITTLRQNVKTRILRKKAAARDAIRVLREPGILAITPDQNQTASFGVFVNFFGKPACTTTGVARLAMQTGAAVMPVFIVREGESAHHRLVVLPDIEMRTTGDREADTVANTQACSDVVEAMIRRYPEQWIWFHKRWKTRPPGEPKLYV
jgi:KDO2-lipid IV(A) lauroyltransferase